MNGLIIYMEESKEVYKKLHSESKSKKVISCLKFNLLLYKS